MRFTKDDELREKSPAQLLEPVIKEEIKFIYKPELDNPDCFDESTALSKKYKLAKTLTENQWEFNAKDKSETPKKKPKKVHSKAKSAAMETV